MAATIDERLKFLLTSTESLHASCQELHAAAVADRQRGEETRKQHEGLRSAMLEAIRTYLEKGGE
jgi:hypothetical protein